MMSAGGFDIDGDWDIPDLKTAADCDIAETITMEAIVSIEKQLLLDQSSGCERGPEWRAKAKGALKFKKRDLQLITRRRSDLNAQGKRQAHYQRRMLELFKKYYPQQYEKTKARLQAIEAAMAGDLETAE